MSALFIALYAAHQVADHWVQTQHQADHKALPGWTGRLACASHVATYGLTQLAAICLLVLALDVAVSPAGLAAGMTLNLVSHYVADRRTPLRWIADRVGAGVFYRLGAPRSGRDDNPSIGTGSYALDQSWHVGFLFLSAVVMAAI